MLHAIVTSPVCGAAATGPLRIHPANPRYFTDDSGKAIYLSGLDDSGEFQDAGTTYPPPSPFDYAGYLHHLQSYGLNFLRMWTFHTPKFLPLWVPGQEWYIEPMPWVRSNQCCAADGRNKFNLDQFNAAYFDRMRDRIAMAADYGIYVQLMVLFDGLLLQFEGDPRLGQRDVWKYHPFNIQNNVNGIDIPDANGNGRRDEFHVLGFLPSAALATQERYVRQVVDTVNDFDNILYEISNEADRHSLPWQEYFVDYIKRYQRTKPKQHPVGISALTGGTNEQLLAGPWDWVSPGSWNEPGDYESNPPIADSRKVIISNTDHYAPEKDVSRQWPWKSFTRGLHTMLLIPEIDRPPLCNPPTCVPRVAVRRAMGDTVAFANRLDLASMTPRPDLASTNYALANPGSEYLVYAPLGSSFTVNLAGRSQDFIVEWFDPTTRATLSGGIVTGGGTKSFTSPFSNAVLYLKAVTSHPTVVPGKQSPIQ
ncbi:MAG TPA: DUF6298 domain-containing protein [Candidatus Binatia bacterium]|nr:DUF6298 domain-containing protein [Candidatus Binatia bacterium]